jgi:uncharacterized protein (DUF983 family)
MVVVVAVALGGLAYYCAYAGPCRTAYDGSLEATTEDCAQDCSACRTDKGAFTGADAALIAAVIVVVGTIVVVVVVGVAAASVPHSLVIVAVIAVLGRKDGGRQKEGYKEERRSELAHLRLDAGFRVGEFCFFVFWGFPGGGVFWREVL